MAEEEIGSLIIKLRADLSSLQADVRKMESTFSGGFSNIQTRAASVGRQVAQSLGLGLSVAAFAGFIRNIITTNDRLSDLADQTKFSAQTLSGLRTTLENAGVGIESFARGIQLSQKTLGNLTEDGGKSAEAMKALGLNIKEMKEASPEEFFAKAVKAIAEFGDQNSRTALQTALFSRSGLQLSGVIDVLARDFEKLAKSGLNEETVRNLGDLADQVHAFSNSLADLTAGPLARGIENIRLFFGLLKPKEDLLFKLNDLENVLSKIDRQIQALQSGNIFSKLANFSFDLSSLSFKTPGGQGLDELKKAREDTLKTIEDIAKRINEANKQPAEGTKKFAPADAEAAKKVKELTENLGKQIIALQGQKVALEQGASAGLRYQLTQDAIAQVGKKLPAGVRDQIEAIISLTKSLEDQKLGLEQIKEEVAKFVDEQEKSFTASQKISDTLQLLANEALQPLDKEIAEVTQRFATMKIEVLAAAVASNQTAGAMEALSAGLDSLKRREIIKLQVFQEDVDMAAKKKDTQDFADSLAKLQERITDTKQIAIALGDPFATFANQIGLAREEVELLTKEFGALSPQVKDAVGELRQLEAIEALRMDFHAITASFTEGIKETVIGIQRGEQTLTQGLQNLFRNALIGLNASILDRTIFGPLQSIMNSFFDGFAEGFAKAGDNAAKEMARSLGKSLGGALRDSVSHLQTGGSGLGGFFNTIFGGLFGGPSTFTGAGGLTSFFPFESGGAVPIIAHSGEFILRRAAVDAIGVDALYKANRDLKLPRMEWGGYIPNTAFTVPRFQGGGVVVPGSSDAGKQPLHVTLVNDYSGSFAPSDMKTGKREVKEFVIDAATREHSFRTILREAVRK